jgi:hypothetical protein
VEVGDYPEDWFFMIHLQLEKPPEQQDLVTLSLGMLDPAQSEHKTNPYAPLGQTGSSHYGRFICIVY